MSESLPPFAAGEAVQITVEMEDGTHYVWGDFCKLDDTGLLYQKRNAGPLAFIPRERIVMIEARV